MQNYYETTFVMTPVLSAEEVKKTVTGYSEFFLKNNAEIVLDDHWGLKQLAYPIGKKTTGIYHHIEFKATSDLIDKLELMFRRDENNIIRFLTIKLDKHAVLYNEKKRQGLAGRNKKISSPSKTEA
jgi:small subunit ribosomal protein S6